MPPEEAAAKAVSIAVALKYRGPAFLISGATHAGTVDLTEAVMRFLESGEAPAQGNLVLPEIKEAKRGAVKTGTSRKKAAPARKKKAAKAKKKVAKKLVRGKPAKKKKKSSASRRKK
jgi:hypothetical protein